MASAASAASAAGGTTTTVPEREFAGLDYANEKADEYRAALDTGANINSRECTNSSPVDFLYLSTIRGGRKTKQMSASGLMSAGGCGCGLVGGTRRRSRSSRSSRGSRRIRGGYEEDGVGVGDAIEYANKYNDQYYDSDQGDNNNTIGEAGETGGETGDAGNAAITGGCFTCKKGIKNITHIYSTIHIIIPTLYGKYKKGVSLKAQKAVKTIQKKPKK